LAKLAQKCEDEEQMEPYGYDSRNNRRNRSIHIAQAHNLQSGNSFFKKIPNSKWTCYPQKGATRK
jgi:hypothetical protein